MSSEERPEKRLKKSGAEKLFQLVREYESFISLESKLLKASTVENLRKEYGEAGGRLIAEYQEKVVTLTHDKVTNKPKTMSSGQQPLERSEESAGGRLLELTAAHESFISFGNKPPASSLSDDLHQKFEDCADCLIVGYKEEVEKLTRVAADFLHKLDNRIHDEATVKEVIEIFPAALKNKAVGKFMVPIVPVQSLLSSDKSIHAYSFVPILTIEARRRKIFTEEEKYGLNFNFFFKDLITMFLGSSGEKVLCERLKIDNFGYFLRMTDPRDTEFQVLMRETDASHDKETRNMLQQLFELNILEKNDIVANRMIFESSQHEHSKKRCDFLINLFPECLKTRDEDNELPIQYNAYLGDAYGFSSLLKAGLKYYPSELGFLFAKSPDLRERTIETAIFKEKISVGTKTQLFCWIHAVFPPSGNHPILHDIIRIAPKYFSLFLHYYPDAIYLRDKDGRLPLHIALQKAPKWSPLLLLVIGINNPIDRHEKDPVNGLYPFMSAASGRRSDLNVIYYLLRRDPSVWEGWEECGTSSDQKECRGL